MNKIMHIQMIVLNLLVISGNNSIKTNSDFWLDSVLGQTKQGVFSADFEDDNNTKVVLGDGDNLTLDCRVFLKQDKTISWLRHTAITSPDVLTVGNITYTGDPRIMASFSYPNNWRLLVTDVTYQDSGLYVCQISTHPPKELHITVLVKDAMIEMVGDSVDSVAGVPPDKYYNPGSHITLKCIIRRNLVKNATVQQITNVSWKKDGELLNLQTEERISMGVEVSGDLVTSILIVNNAADGDAGSYSCTLPVFGNADFPRARANVHLIYGDRLAVYGTASTQTAHAFRVFFALIIVMSSFNMVSSDQFIV